MTGLWLLARIGDVEVALAAEHISAIARVGHVAPMPLAPPAIIGLTMLRSRIVVLVDCAMLCGERLGSQPGGDGLGSHPVDGARTMAMVDVDGFTYGLLLDDVADVQQLGAPEPCPIRLGPAWALLDPMMVQHDDHVRIALDPAHIVAIAHAHARDHAQLSCAA